MRSLLLSLSLLLAACATTPEPAPPLNVAYAWATFDRAGITAHGAYGLADRVRNRPLTVDDPARIASVTKLIVAIAVVRLVEQGRLDLDRDVSDQLGWRLCNPAFPDRPITLRLLLSHTSSLRDEVDYAIPLGTTIESVLANPAAFDTDHTPGSFFRYSNLNFPVIASVMERATGERFDRLIARLVLGPLGLDACMNWTTCSDATVGRAAVLYDGAGAPIRDDLGGQRPACPVFAPEGRPCDLGAYVLGSNGALFSPQGGLRISVRDLATVGRLLLNGGRHGRDRLLSEASVRTLLTPQWRYDGANGEIDRGFYCAYGLASQSLPVGTEGCHDDLFGDGRAVSGHAGDAYGLRSGVWIDRRAGRGIAYFSTGNGEDPPRGRSAYRAIEEQLARNLRR
jgi:CubicO group peptidase (beta-lactamase class C family)